MTIDEARDKWDGVCIEFVGEVIDTFPQGRLAYFETPWNAVWRYHAAYEINGMIHCLWHFEPLPLEEFMEAIGADTVEYPAEEPETTETATCKIPV